MADNWTIEKLKKSGYCSQREAELIGFAIENGEAVKLTMKELLARAEASGIIEVEAHSILYALQKIARQLNVLDFYASKRMTDNLPKAFRLEVLGSWFNGGGGLPRADASLYLGHPSLLDWFLNWLIAYLASHNSIDGRIGQRGERVINLCREIEGLGPVRRF